MTRAVAQLAWTCELAASEFGLHRVTVAQRIKRAGVTPSIGGKYTTAEIHRAICGDIEAERLRKVTAEADQIEIENARAMEDLVPAAIVVMLCQELAVRARQLIRSWDCDEVKKKEWLREFRERDTDAIIRKVIASVGGSNRVWTRHSGVATQADSKPVGGGTSRVVKRIKRKTSEVAQPADAGGTDGRRSRSRDKQRGPDVVEPDGGQDGSPQ